MALARYDIEKFDGKGDFDLWKAKIKAILGQQKALHALTDPTKLPTTISEEDKESMINTAYGTIILNLSNSVLRQVIDQETPQKIWKKLNDLYETKSAHNQMYMREKFFTFKMDAAKTLTENLDEFKRMTSEFKNLGEKIGDENEAFVLLNSLPEAYKEVKTALKYGRENITTDAIISAIRTKELEILSLKKETSEGMFVKGKNKNKEGKNQADDKSKSKVRCNYCHKEGHIKRDCYSLKRKNQYQRSKKNKQPEASVGENSITYSDALATSDKKDDQSEASEKHDWVIDSGCSFHMTPNKG